MRSFLEAEAHFVEKLSLYSDICEIFNRSCMITPQILKRYYLGTLPSAISRQIETELPKQSLFKDIRAKAIYVSDRAAFNEEPIPQCHAVRPANNEYKCFGCDKTGHYRNDCPQRDATCATCGK